MSRCIDSKTALALAAIAALLVAQTALAAEPRKVAFLVGVSKYEKAGLNDLTYAEADVTALADALKSSGFFVQTLLGSGEGDKRASRENIKTQLEGRFAENIKRLNKDDVVLIGLSGHGQQLDVVKGGGRVEDHFFCPVDALKTDPATLVSVSELMELVGRNSGAENNLFVIDACRDNPGKGAGKGIDGSRISLPRNMAAIFGSSAGKQSYESRQLQHGLLTYYLLEGLKGNAKDNDGDITWDSLVNYTKKQVIKNAPTLVGEQQTPNSVSKVTAAPVLARVELRLPPGKSQPAEGSRAGDVREDNGLKQKLVWCPKGTFRMGSPKGEDGHSDEESQVSVTLSKGFWLGQTSVTQSQFKLVMGSEPWKDQEDVKQGANYPATYVDWNDATEFCKKLTESEGRAGRLPQGWKYDLPTEAQREYATRAGTTTAYVFGNDAGKLSDYAWFVKNAYDVGQKYAHEVGTKKPNAWGLYDLHGNVWEWCRDYYADKLPGGVDPFVGTGSHRVSRGGGWIDIAANCRSAFRDNPVPSNRFSNLGFRLALVPSS